MKRYEWIEKVKRDGAVVVLVWFVGWLSLLLLIGTARADIYCFEQDAENQAIRNAWTYQSVVLWGAPPRVSPGGTVMIPLRGYGYNAAPKPTGGTDTAPLIGAAVRDFDGTWNVSVFGTLAQYSSIGVIGGVTADAPAYYLISLWWQLNPFTLAGKGRMGTVSHGLNPHIPGAVDDTYALIVWPVDCGLLR